MSFDIVKNKVLSILLEIYKCESQNNLKQLFKSNYLLEYNIFVKQIVFEIYYEYYKSKAPLGSISSSLNFKDTNLASNANYKKTTRTYQHYRTYQDNISIDLNNGKDVQFKALNHGKESFYGHKVYEWQKNQLKNLASDKYKIFREITKGTLGDVNRLSNKNLIEYLKEYENIYTEIKNQETNYFNRSFHYYQLEIGNRIETFYTVANSLNNFNITYTQKKRIINELKCLSAIENLQNKFIVGLDQYINYHINASISNNGDIYKVSYDLYDLNRIKYSIRYSILDWIKKDMIELDFNEYSIICKDYIGNMQHINTNKNWDTTIKSFRLFYK